LNIILGIRGSKKKIKKNDDFEKYANKCTRAFQNEKIKNRENGRKIEKTK